MNSKDRKTSNLIITQFIALFVLSVPLTTWAKDSYTVKQEDKKFSELFVKLKSEDVIKFINLDSVKHRLIFTHKGQQEQMNAIAPGGSQEVTFSHSGIYDVQCKHHPEMKLTIFIPYVANITRKDSIYMF
jgi:plastocyanin